MNKLFEIIFQEVSRQFRSERAFYHHTLGITQRAWEKYKMGETNFDDIKLSTYKRMVGVLFTPYEVLIVDEAIQAVNFNWYDNVKEAFHSLKTEKAKEMVSSGAKIESVGANFEMGQPLRNSLNEIKITDKLGNSITFEIEIPSTRPEHHHLRMPSGNKNKKEWFEKYFEEIVKI